jgi:hypothetical protein
MSAADENVPTHIETTDDDDASTVDSDLTSVVPDADPCILPTESSYLSGASPTGIIRPSNPDYDLCTPADLKGLMHSRGLRDSYPKGLTLKYFYLRQLDKADRAARFRFLELPAEIRLGVYRELLLFPDREDVKLGQADDVVYLAILLTCEQVYDEAKPVLYDDNVFSVGFRKIEEEGKSTLSVQKVASFTVKPTRRAPLVSNAAHLLTPYSSPRYSQVSSYVGTQGVRRCYLRSDQTLLAPSCHRSLSGILERSLLD